MMCFSQTSFGLRLPGMMALLSVCYTSIYPCITDIMLYSHTKTCKQNVILPYSELHFVLSSHVEKTIARYNLPFTIL
jgi:hypothetical protein